MVNLSYSILLLAVIRKDSFNFADYNLHIYGLRQIKKGLNLLIYFTYLKMTLFASDLTLIV